MAEQLQHYDCDVTPRYVRHGACYTRLCLNRRDCSAKCSVNVSSGPRQWCLLNLHSSSGPPPKIRFGEGAILESLTCILENGKGTHSPTIRYPIREAESKNFEEKFSASLCPCKNHPRMREKRQLRHSERKVKYTKGASIANFSTLRVVSAETAEFSLYFQFRTLIQKVRSPINLIFTRISRWQDLRFDSQMGRL